jgi:large subunit ribosomal protein L31
MKEKIHPKYVECTVTCGCGEHFATRATVEKLNVEVCSKCHPFYTGKQKFVDAAGRLERFQKRFNWDDRKGQLQKDAEQAKEVRLKLVADEQAKEAKERAQRKTEKTQAKAQVKSEEAARLKAQQEAEARAAATKARIEAAAKAATEERQKQAQEKAATAAAKPAAPKPTVDKPADADKQ